MVVFRESSRTFMQNDWKTRDPGRSHARSDGREKLSTWPASQALELAANRRVRFLATG